MMRPFLLVLSAAVFVAGCSTSPVRLQHPRTGQIAVCGPYPATGIPSISTPGREARCIGDFQRQGYERLP